MTTTAGRPPTAIIARDRTSPRRPRDSRWGVLEGWIIVSFGASALLPIFIATAARPTGAMKAAQALVFGWIFFSAAPVLLLAARRQITAQVLAVYGVMLLLATPVITQRYFSLSWVVGDMLLLSTPLLLGIALRSSSVIHPRLLDRLFEFTVATLLVAAVVGSFFPDPADSFRYSPPAPLLMAAVWMYFLTKRGWAQAVAGLGVAVVAVLTWNSQWRSSALVFLFIGIVAVVFLVKGPARMMLALAMTALSAWLVLFGIPLQGQGGGPSDNRIVETFQEGGLQNDSSTMFRFVEARAVAQTAGEEWNPVNLLIGGGHGATYNFNYLDVLPGSSRFEERNGSDGRVHNVHLGALMIAYRYGLFGIAFALTAVGLALRGVWRGAKHRDMNCFVAALAFVGCAQLHMANNVTTQIHFTVTAALLVPLLGRVRREKAESTGSSETIPHAAEPTSAR